MSTGTACLHSLVGRAYSAADVCGSVVGWLAFAALPERFFMSTDGLLKALQDSQRYLDIVHKPQLGKSEAQWLVETTVENFAQYFNSGFIEYRKSVAEADDYASVEWTGSGATFKDTSGRQYIDCLG